MYIYPPHRHMRHCPIRLLLQNTRSKIKSLSISRQQQSIKISEWPFWAQGPVQLKRSHTHDPGPGSKPNRQKLRDLSWPGMENHSIGTSLLPYFTGQSSHRASAQIWGGVEEGITIDPHLSMGRVSKNVQPFKNHTHTPFWVVMWT